MGLGSYWGEVMDVLREIIPIYDKVNSIISLGKDVEHRNRGISQRVLPGNKILDAGSGFGNMSKTPFAISGNSSKYVLVFFNIGTSGYSLRDAINLRIAISEVHRVLKKGGRFVIVDLGKPDELFFRTGVSFYLRCILPILALIAGGRLGLKFGTLYGTYKRWPQNKKLEKLLLEKFSKVEFEKDLMGGAIMVAAYK